MNPLLRFLSVILTLAAALPGRSSNTSLATAGAVGIVLGPLGLQAVSGSQLNVTVEVYRDTLKWDGYDAQGRPCYLFGGEPFRLGGPLAMKAQLQHLANTAASPSAEAVAKRVDQIRGLLATQPGRLQDLRRTRDRLADAFKQHKPSESGQALLTEMDDVLKRNDQLAAVFGSLQDRVAAALTDGEFSADEVTKAGDQLLAVRLIAAGIPRDFSPNLGGFLRTQLQAALVGALGPAPEAAGVAAGKLKAMTALVAMPPAETADGQIHGVENLLWHLAENVRALQQDGWHFVQGAKVHTASPEAISEAINSVLDAVGYRADFKALVAVTDRKEFSVRWDDESNAIQRAAGVPIQIADLTFTGVAVSASFGPIASEVIQGLLAENDLIDRVATDESRWQRYNYAYSHGGAGNHNAIVYLDNMLTPVLKSASFDPSLFLAANAQVYKRATIVLSNVVGAPMAKDTAATGGGLESLNLLDLKARKHKAVKSAATERDRMLALIKLVLDEHAALTGQQVNPPVPAKPEVPAVPAHDGQPEQPLQPAEDAKPAAWKDEAKAKTHLLELVQALGAAATRLEQH